MAERDENGRFVKGHNVKSPGRPARSVEREYLEMLTDAVTPEKWQKIIRKAITQATAGDRFAREWIANYIIGKPAQTINLTAGDQLMLKELLDYFEQAGYSASELFSIMMQEIAQAADDSE